MKVADFMQTSVVSVTENDETRRVVRYIFNLGISGVPVVKDKKLIGIVTEKDILTRLFPSISQVMEEGMRESLFDEIESNLTSLLPKKIKEIMSKTVRSVSSDLPLMRAQSMMITNQISRLPVVNNKKELIGIISQGDIFRALAGQEIPFDDKEDYDAWLSYHYDLVVQWGDRLGAEIPEIDRIFRENNIKTIVDIFCGTGEHDIALAQKGYNVIGVNKYKLMHEKALRKYNQLSARLQDNVDFKHDDYVTFLKKNPHRFDAAIILGNALSHSPGDYKEILASLDTALVTKNALVILQIANFERILRQNKRLQDFNIAQAKIGTDDEYAFVEFFDPPHGEQKNLTLTMAVLSRRRRWMHSAINSTLIAYLRKDNLESLLKKAGFKHITFYGSRSLEPLFKTKFDVKKHDWLNVVAQR